MLSVYRSMRFGTRLSCNISPLKYSDCYFVFIEMNVDFNVMLCGLEPLFLLGFDRGLDVVLIKLWQEHNTQHKYFRYCETDVFTAASLATWVNRGVFQEAVLFHSGRKESRCISWVFWIIKRNFQKEWNFIHFINCTYCISTSNFLLFRCGKGRLVNKGFFFQQVTGLLGKKKVKSISFFFFNALSLSSRQIG